MPMVETNFVPRHLWRWIAGPNFALIFTAAVAALSLDSFDLDLASNTLFMTFDETVSASTEDIDWSGVSLRTHKNELKGSGVVLWNTETGRGWGEAVSTDSGRKLSVEIHPKDLDEMKALSIGHNTSYTWLTLRRGTFAALKSGEGNKPVFGTQVVGSAGMSVSELIQDSSSPTLDRFVLGPTGRQLALFFSEGVNLSTFDPSALSLSYVDWAYFSNASLSCSSPRRGRDGSWREIVLHLDTPCPRTTISSVMYNNLSSSENNTSVTFAGGYSSDWSMLVDSKVFLSGVDSGSPGMVLLSAASTLVTDSSAAANDLVALMDLKQSFPDCQPCGNGTFRSEPCTEIFDAVCMTCAAECPGRDMFILAPCTAETDLDCHRCTPCPFETREIEDCNQTSDRVCKACTECAVGEYEIRDCHAAGDDRICESCLRCFMSPEVAKACRASPLVLPWQLENCCETVEGEQVPCMRVPLEDLRVSTREGRRHWVFEPSIPPVDGYTQNYWGQGRAARDAVSPQDQLIEVDFRQGARSVFDDPRYVGQEGPTGGDAAGGSSA
ncbi:unnamed protein product [Ascophyllum nodosum]